MVVEHQCRALGEVEPVGQLEAEVRRRDRLLRPRAEHAERRHPVPGRDGRTPVDRPHDPADLAAGGERQVGLDLIGAAGLQQLGE